MLGIDAEELPEVQGKYAYELLKKLREVKVLEDDEEEYYNFLRKKYEKE